MPFDFEFWMIAGCLGLSLLAFGLGAAVRAGHPGGPPALPLGPGLGGWRVAEGLYLPLDLGVAALLVGFYAVLPLLARSSVPVDAAEVEASGGGIGMVALLLNAVAQFFMMALVIGVVAVRRHPVDWLGLRWRPGPWILTVVLVVAGGLVATIATGMFALSLEATGYQKWLLGELGIEDQAEAMQDVVKAFEEAAGPGVFAMLCLTAVVVAPITEEVIFRGYLYPVAKRFAGRWAGIAFSSLLFAMVHQNAMALLPLAFLAVLLALSYEFTGSIWAPIGIHMFFNGTTVFYQIALRMQWVEPPAT